MGTLTPRGVYKYANTDTAPNAAALLNLAQDALDTLLQKLPKDMQGGSASVVSSGGSGSYPPVNVLFPRPFSNAPVVTASPSSPAATVGISNVTNTGFTITITRTGTTTTVVQWIAAEF